MSWVQPSPAQALVVWARPRACSPSLRRTEWQCVKAGKVLRKLHVHFGGFTEDETDVLMDKEFSGQP